MTVVLSAFSNLLFDTNLYKVFYLRPEVKKGFSLKIIEHILSMLVVHMSTIFCISDNEELPGIFLISVSEFFLFIPSTPVITQLLFVFTCHILEISIFRSLYFESLSNFFVEMFYQTG